MSGAGPSDAAEAAATDIAMPPAGADGEIGDVVVPPAEPDTALPSSTITSEDQAMAAEMLAAIEATGME